MGSQRNREKERRLQAPFGPSVDLLCHPCFTTTNLSYRFPTFETFVVYLHVSQCGVVVVVVVVYLSMSLFVSLKTKLFRETSSVVEFGNIKNAALVRDLVNF